MIKFHYFKQKKMNPPMHPFIRLSRWHGFVVIIGLHEIGFVKVRNVHD